MNDNDVDIMIRHLFAEVTLMRSIVAFLCVTTLPKLVLDTYVEQLDIPVAGDSPDVTQAVLETTDRFLGEIAKLRRTLDENGGQG